MNGGSPFRTQTLDPVSNYKESDMKFKFNLTRTKGEKSPLRLAITDKDLPGGRLYASTGITVKIADWKPKEQELKELKKSDPANGAINARLHDIKKELKEFLDDENNTINKATITHLINPEVVRVKGELTMIEWMRDDLTGRANIKKSTVKSIRESIDVLEDYTTANAPDLSFHNFTFTVYEKFEKYMNTVRNNGNGMMPSSMGKVIKNIKALLSRADLNSSFSVCADYHRFVVKRESMDDPRIALQAEERKALLELDLSNNPRLDKARDLFLLGVFTGMRESDFSEMKKEDFNLNKNVIGKMNQKTGKYVYIPFFGPVKDLYQKYDGDFPTLSQQKLNEYIKEVAVLAELDRMVPVKVKEKGLIVSKSIPLNEALSSHDARRTFVTAALNEWKIPVADVAGITGQALKTIQRYNNPDREEVAAKYSNLNVA